MKLNEFDHAKYGIKGSGVECEVKVLHEWKNKTTGELTAVLNAGECVKVWFSPKMYSGSIFVQYKDFVGVSKAVNAHQWLTKFTKMPTMRTLEKYSWDGIAKTVIGEKTEPDGFGPTGAPSWLLVVGII